MMAAKTLKEFDALRRRDFDNGAIDEIRGVYKQRAELLAALEALYEATAALLIGLRETLGVSMDDDDFPPRMREAIEQAHVALADARGEEAESRVG